MTAVDSPVLAGMPSVTEAPCCALCSGEDMEFRLSAEDVEFGVPERFDFWGCTDCGSLQLHPMPDEATVATFYPPAYTAYHGGSAATKWLMNRYFAFEARRLARLLPEGRARGRRRSPWNAAERGHLVATSLRDRTTGVSARQRPDRGGD